MGARSLIREIRLTYWRPDPNKYGESTSKIRFSSEQAMIEFGLDGWKCKSVSVIRSRSYGCSVDSVVNMAAIAKIDYPSLQDSDIRIVQFGGDSYKRTFGIEFDAPGDGLVAPNGWQEILELEYTL